MHLNDWDRVVIRSMQRACDAGTPEGVKKSWAKRRGAARGIASVPRTAHSNTHEGVTSMLKSMLEKIKRKAQPSKYTTTTTHKPGTKKVEPKTGNIQQTASKTETVSRPKTAKADDPFKHFKQRSEKQNTVGPAHSGEVKAKAPERDRHGKITSGSVNQMNKEAEENS